MGFLRDTIVRFLDRIDPPRKPVPLTPCPGCGTDLSKKHSAAHGGKDDLIFFRCFCGEGSAWYWNGSGPQLIYSGAPDEVDDE